MTTVNVAQASTTTAIANSAPTTNASAIDRQAKTWIGQKVASAKFYALFHSWGERWIPAVPQEQVGVSGGYASLQEAAVAAKANWDKNRYQQGAFTCGPAHAILQIGERFVPFSLNNELILNTDGSYSHTLGYRAQLEAPVKAVIDGLGFFALGQV